MNQPRHTAACGCTDKLPQCEQGIILSMMMHASLNVILSARFADFTSLLRRTSCKDLESNFMAYMSHIHLEETSESTRRSLLLDLMILIRTRIQQDGSRVVRPEPFDIAMAWINEGRGTQCMIKYTVDILYALFIQNKHFSDSEYISYDIIQGLLRAREERLECKHWATQIEVIRIYDTTYTIRRDETTGITQTILYSNPTEPTKMVLSQVHLTCEICGRGRTIEDEDHLQEISEPEDIIGFLEDREIHEGLDQWITSVFRDHEYD